MVPIFISNALVSDGFNNAPALRQQANGEVLFNVGHRVPDPQAQGGSRWINRTSSHCAVPYPVGRKSQIMGKHPGNSGYACDGGQKRTDKKSSRVYCSFHRARPASCAETAKWSAGPGLQQRRAGTKLCQQWPTTAATGRIHRRSRI